MRVNDARIFLLGKPFLKRKKKKNIMGTDKMFYILTKFTCYGQCLL